MDTPMARILLAEDDKANRELATHALEADGHQVSPFDNGADALAAFENGAPFDLLVTDVDMPNMSGVALAEAILAKRPDQRVIIMSALADELAQARNMVSPTVRLMTKPVTLETLRSTTAELLR